MVGTDGRGEIRLQRLQRPRVSTARSTTTSTKYRSKSKFPRQRSVVDAWRGFRMAARRRRSTSIGSTSIAAAYGCPSATKRMGRRVTAAGAISSIRCGEIVPARVESFGEPMIAGSDRSGGGEMLKALRDQFAAFGSRAGARCVSACEADRGCMVPQHGER